ncbi:PAS domain S-box protein [candidate division KSB1 bacterium]|nr:PAS domain S-box protein [candidate division KSB1 bacterium]RQW00846.1 MAG: PAS domain S-box protein [candidate division KSB1 bacterium]
MNFTFEKPSLKKQRFQLNTKIVIPLTLILAAILIISAVLDYWGTKRELSHILKEQSLALITALEKGSQNAIESYNLVQDIIAERLSNNARLLEEMDYAGRLDEAYLRKVAEQNRIFRINVYDAQGDKVMASFRGFGWGAEKSAPSDLMTAMQKENVDELVMGFRSSRFGDGRRFAIAKKRRKGGVLVLNVDSQEMLEFRRSIGLGKLIREIGANEGVKFIALQDSAGIIIATEGVDSLSTIAHDKLLKDTQASGNTGTRFIHYKGQRIFEIIHPFTAQKRELLRIGLGTSHIEEAERSALTRAMISSLLLLIFGGVIANWVISNQNVRALQKAYQRIETHTGSMLENMTDAIIAVDHNGDITLVNDAAEKMFGIASEHVLGKSCANELVAICPFLKKGLETSERKIYPEEKLASSNGLLTVFITINIVKNKKGELDIVFAVIRDITELVRLEENLKRKDKIAAMGHLASGVAHEIRNPLNAIGMIAQRFRTEFQPTSDEHEYKQLASTMVNETRRINDIIRQFLQFAKPSEPVKSRINLSAIVHEVATLLRQEAQAKAVQVDAHCHPVPDIHADADKLKQALLNIGQNALDACEANAKIQMTCEQKDLSILVRISDTGKGIPATDVEKLFNLYFTTKEKGTGIGLSVVQQVISQHNGTIDVYSEENKGTTFSIFLPIS